jgi:RNA polymerase sigma-70 factor, ECF subfamily
MELANNTRRPSLEVFEAEALPFLSNVARYARMLTRDSADADDLTQETFLRAYESWTTYRPGTDCRKWLFAICRNLHLRHQERAQRFVAVDDADEELYATRQLYLRAVSEGFKDVFDQIDLGPALEKSLAMLNAEYREAIVLIDIEDSTYADAAATLGVPIGTVRSRLFRGRRLLQQGLLEYARDLGFGVAAPPPAINKGATT